MRVKTLEELQVWQRARKLVVEVSAIAAGGGFGRDPELRSQLTGAADSVLANVGEGYGQATDRAFARYLYIARGSANEVRAHLAAAAARGCVESVAVARVEQEATEIAKMISGLIRYLHSCDWKDRY
jgi:four helix bundle protein